MAVPKAGRILSFSLLAIVLAVTAAEFARAWRVKRVLSNAAQHAARIIVSTPLAAQTCPEPVPYAPCSIQLATDAAKQYLTKAEFRQASCITPKAPSFSGVLVWVFSCDGSTACDSSRGSVCVKIDMNNLDVGTNKTLVSNTKVTLQYPHAWMVGSVLKPLPGRPTIGLPKSISASAIMRN